LDLDTDEMEVFDELDSENEEETTAEIAALVEQAEAFYQREVDRYEAME
jgi:predicted transcriptional regulator